MDPLSPGQVRRCEPPDGLTLAPLNGGHAPQVREVARGSFPRLWEPKEFAYFLDHGCGLALGAFKGEALVGYFLGLLVAGDLDVVSIATRLDWRRRGVGRWLLTEALRRPAVERAFLEVDCLNTPAVHLYESLGFSRVGVRRSYYDGLRDAHQMRWERRAA